jgi:hypothetical protein
MIKDICEHSIMTSIIGTNSTVLDVGCRDFGFTNAMKALGCKVYSIDPDILDGDYYRCAISNEDGLCGLVHTKDPQGKYIKTGNEIKKYTIESFGKMVGIDQWDVVKLDCEGEEYNILISLTSPPAKQLSIEFHEHTERKIGRDNIDMILKHLDNWYDRKVINWDTRHGAGYNYWDVLLVLKEFS